MLDRNLLDEKLRGHDFEKLARQESNGRRRIRLLALAHLQEGKGYAETGRALKSTSGAVKRWANWWIEGGLTRLRGMPKTWSNQKLPQEQAEALREAIERLQAERGGGRVRGEEIRQLLKERFGVVYCLNGVYELLKRLKVVWISARSISPKADETAQAAFKKGIRAEGSKRIAHWR